MVDVLSYVILVDRVISASRMMLLWFKCAILLLYLQGEVFGWYSFLRSTPRHIGRLNCVKSGQNQGGQESFNRPRQSIAETEISVSKDFLDINNIALQVDSPSINLLQYPYNNIVDVNAERQTIIYEVILGRDLGMDIIQGNGFPVVGQIFQGSKAHDFGIEVGDTITAISATAGDQMWSHDSLEGVKSALSTRFVMSSTVKFRLERSLSKISQTIKDNIRIATIIKLSLNRPIGLHVVEGADKGVFVKALKEDLGAAKSGKIAVGDQIVAMSASWGDRMWEVNSVESFVVGVKMRTDTQIRLNLKRYLSLSSYMNRQQRKFAESVSEKSISFIDDPNLSASDIKTTMNPQNYDDAINKAANGSELAKIWISLKKDNFLTTYLVNKFMVAALSPTIEEPDLAIDAFEYTFDFNMNVLDTLREDELNLEEVEKRKNYLRHGTKQKPFLESSISFDSNRDVINPSANASPLQPNNFVCTTAIKAYGRKNEVEKARAVLPWLESMGGKVDDYLLSSLLYVLAKAKRVAEAEDLFWNEFPSRNISYTVATTNSLMYMYAILNRPDDALRVYELAKTSGLRCTVVTYGVLIKALLKSNRNKMRETSFEILQSLPELGISPTIEIYNQFLEHFASKQDFRQSKNVLRLMSLSTKIKPNAISYGYLINLCAGSKKPRVALKLFHQMRRRNYAANAYAYMGVLKALACMRDGLNAVQVITEMRELGVLPGLRHYAMAMFACIIAKQNVLAESLFSLAIRTGERPDTALLTLYMRALLQQGKWPEALTLYRNMADGVETARPNVQTMNCLLQFQILETKYTDAMETISMIMDRYNLFHSSKKSNVPQSLKGTFKIISLALGSYSSEMQRRNKEDKEFSTGTAIDELDDYLNFENGPSHISRPSPEALSFLTSCVQRICSMKNGYIQGDFYMELLRALVLEEQSESARRLFLLKESGFVRFTSAQEEKSANIEEIAKKMISGNERQSKVM